MSRLKFNLYKTAIYSIILAMCTSMMLYFTWKIPPIYANFFALICVLPLLFTFKIKLNDIWIIFLITLSYFYDFLHIRWSLSGLANNCFLIGIVSFVVLSPDKLKIRLYHTFDSFLKLICLISLVGWILYLIGIPLPHYYSPTTDFYSHEVFYFFIMGANTLITDSTSIIDMLPRFCGLFLEPGHIGSTACLMLYVNQFNFQKRSNLIYLFSILLSLSLAAYCLLFIGLILFYYLRGQNIFKYLCGVFIIILGIVLFGMNYNEGDNVINDKIIERLIITDGKLAGDNRTTSEFDYHYNRWLDGGNIVWGFGSKAYGDGDESGNVLSGTASYKRFFFINGIIGIILVFALYLTFFFKNYSRLGVGLFILLLICNMIRDYPYRLMWLCIFIVGLVVVKDIDNNKNKLII